MSSEIAAKVQISVTNVNDCPPVFTQNEYNVTLLLPTYQNVVVAQLNATDRDDDDSVSKQHQTLRYEFVETTNKSDIFALNHNNGVITTR